MRLALIVTGLVMATGQAPLGWAWPAFLGLAVGLFLVTRADTVRSMAFRGWLLGLGYFAGALFWIVEPFFVDAARHGWMAPFALFLLAGGMALFWSAGCALAAWLGRRHRVIWIVLTLTGAELARGYVLTGFPWALIGYIWVDTPQLQVVALVGPYGLTFLTIAAAALPAILGQARILLGAFIAGAALSAPAAYGLWQLSQPMPVREVPLTMRLIQPNAPQHLKWDPDHIPEFFQRQLDLTAERGAAEPDLIIWPETAVPYMLENAGQALQVMSHAAGGTPLVFGAQRRDGYAAHNSLAVIGPDATVTHLYDKHHLVPFGEYFPMAHIFGRFGLRGLAEVAEFGYTPGPGAQVLDLGPLGKMLPLICYEAIFPQDLLAAPERADWILQITNDAWFGNIAGPHQHLAQAQVRAVEQGLPFLRSANTGISAVIDARGRVIDALPLNTAGSLDANLPAGLPPTLYSRIGDLPMAMFLAVLASVLALLTRRKAVDGTSQGT
ncbi:apolipoprotein N-acyltransferase [Actibacterium sp. 188UL27-1]|uniref:apolipoprotein N-acyltransferase n=1 Tax=Actibacterium sp. 188UL27-1 TaxID=2786961 RepID=UPI00195738C5|nr:apolipoprotein N-acyltransferase [Actibacterium sp. 188UL27-1]MBM7067358.1 apolipoprotein N-acyltransferase [Actibacterium sp. 188UL27-1]